jgi:hypothetical protein
MVGRSVLVAEGGGGGPMVQVTRGGSGRRCDGMCSPRRGIAGSDLGLLGPVYVGWAPTREHALLDISVTLTLPWLLYGWGARSRIGGPRSEDHLVLLSWVFRSGTCGWL